MSDCRFVDRHAGTLLDGELDPASIIAMERHLDVCAPCQERLAFERRSRSMTRESLGDVRAPDAFKARLAAAIADAPEPVPGAIITSPRFGFIGYGGVAAVAAAMLLFAGKGIGSGVTAAGVASDSAAGPVRPLIEDVVRLHSNELPADVTADSVQQVPAFFRGRVAFPVRPAQFEQRDVHFVGARYANVAAHGAVALYYDVGGQRMTVVVYEAPPDASEGVRRVRMGRHEMLYHDVHGHAVPVVNRGDLQYAFTGDLDRDQLLRLAAAAHVSP